MRFVTSNDIANIFRAVSIELHQASDDLCQLDGQIGDGDHGTTMALGFNAIVQGMVEVDFATMTIDQILSKSADNFLNAVGATTGPLYASAFLSAASFATGMPVVAASQAPLLLVAMSEGIAARGNAQLGDKTMMDVWFPVAQHIRAGQQAKVDLLVLSSEIRKIANNGVSATKTMVASKGRAARLGERSLGHADPGATSAAIMIGCFCDFFEGISE